MVGCADCGNVRNGKCAGSLSRLCRIEKERAIFPMTINLEHHLHPNPNSELQLNVTPASAGWQYLSFSLRTLSSGRSYMHLTEDTEVAIVPLEGEGRVSVGDQSFTLRRENVFAGK